MTEGRKLNPQSGSTSALAEGKKPMVETMKYYEGNTSKLESLWNETLKMTAVQDAASAEGSFPILLFAQGAAYEWCIFAEYLASHGYIVAGSPTLGSFEAELDWNHLGGIETQVRDLEIVLKEAVRLPGADKDKVATAGAFYGAMAAVSLATRHSEVKAVLSLDGGIGSDWGGYMLSRMPFYDVEKITAPIMHLYSSIDPGTNLRWFRDYKHSERYMVAFGQMRHMDFVSFSMLEQYVPGIVGEAKGDPNRSYSWMCRYAQNFLDAKLKNDSGARDFLAKEPKEHDIPGGILALEIRKGSAAPPNLEELVKRLEQSGLSSLTSLYRERKKLDPKPFSSRTFREIGSWLRENKKTSEMEEWGKLYEETYPGSADAQLLLGKADREKGDDQAAYDHYIKALGLIWRDPEFDNWHRDTFEPQIREITNQLQQKLQEK